jgi:stage III sporulation protein AG
MDINKLLDDLINKVKKIYNNTSGDGKIEKRKTSKIPNFLIICLSVILASILLFLGNDIVKSTSTAKIIPTNSQAEDKISSVTGLGTRDYETEEENKLKSTLEQIDGVGKVTVMLTIDGSEEQIPAVNINGSTSNTKEKDNAGGTRETTQQNNGSTIVTTSDGSKNTPLIVKTKKPKIMGVVVIAEGAKDRTMELKIIQAVTKLYNIQTDKVSVYAMQKK